MANKKRNREKPSWFLTDEELRANREATKDIDQRNKLRKLYEQSYNRTNAINAAASSGRAVSKDFLDETNRAQRAYGKAISENEEFIKKQYGNETYNSLFADYRNMRKSSNEARKYFGNEYNRLEYRGLSEEDKRAYIKDNERQDKKNKFEKALEYFSSALGNSAQGQMFQAAPTKRNQDNAYQASDNLGKSVDDYQRANNDYIANNEKRYSELSKLYKSYTEKPDFAENSKKDAAIAKRNSEYKYLNSSLAEKEVMKRAANKNYSTGEGGLLPIESSPVSNAALMDNMSAEEISIYNYITKTEGAKAASKYLDHIALGESGIKAMDEAAKRGEAFAELNPKTAAAVRMFSMVPEGISSTLGTAVGLTGNKAGENALYQPSVSMGAVERSVESQINEWANKKDSILSNDIVVFDKNYGNLYSNAYKFTDSAARSAIASFMLGGNVMAAFQAEAAGGRLVQGLINIPISMAAYGDQYYQGRQNGLSDYEAKKICITTAAVEWTTEFLGGFFGKEFSGFVGQINNEALEELTGNIMNVGINILDSALYGKDNDFQIEYAELINEGKSVNEAIKIMLARHATEEAITYIGTAVSMIPATGTQYIKQHKVYSGIGKSIRNSEDSGNKLNELVIAASMLPTESEANKTISKFGKDTKLTDAKIGELYVNTIASAEEVLNNSNSFDELTNNYTAITSDSSMLRMALDESFQNNFKRLSEEGNKKSNEALKSKTKSAKTETPSSKAETNSANSETNSTKSEELEASSETKKVNFALNAIAGGNNILLTGVERTSENNITLVTPKGETVSIDEISAVSPRDERVLNDAVSGKIYNLGPVGAALFIQKGLTVSDNNYSEFNTYSKMLYKFGATGTEWSVVQKGIPQAINALDSMNKGLAKRFFEAGRSDSLQADEIRENNKQKKKTAVQRNGEGKFVNKTGDETLDKIFKTLADKLHITINYVMSGEDNENGSFEPKTGTLTVVQGAARGDLTSLAHEIGEYARAYNYEAYKQYVDTLIKMLSKMGAISTSNDILAYHNTYHSDNKNTTIQDAKEELANDVTARLFFSEGGIEESVEWVKSSKELSVEEKKNFFETLKDIINHIVETVKEHVTNKNLTNSEKAVANMSLDDIKKLRKQFISVIDGAISNLENGVEIDTERKNSFETSSNGLANDLLNEYDDNLKDVIVSSGGIIVDSYSSLVRTVDLAFDEPNRKATAYFGTVDYSVLKSIENDVANLPQSLRDNLFKKNKSYSIAMTLDSIRHIINDKPGLKRGDVVEYLDKFPDIVLERDSVAYDVYTDSKGQKSNGLLFKKAFNDGLMLTFDTISNSKKSLKLVTIYMESGAYIKKKSATTPQLQNAVAHTSKTQGGQTSTNNIPQNAEKSNTKKSLDVDSEGNALSEQQQVFFKDSKVRDENGNLLVVYHGTAEDFTVFDRTKGRSNMDIQGSFFSPWELDAKGYGLNVKAYYLNIKKPATEQTAYRALRMYQGENNAGVKAREYLESLGYDGVNNENEEYIAFYPEQIKQTDNKTPTDNPDIRYLKDVVTGDEETNNAITVDMADSERAEVLKGVNITITDDNSSEIDINVDDYDDIKSRIEKPLREKLDKLGVFKNYKSDAVDIDFEFTHKGFGKSLHSQIEYGGENTDFVRVVANLEQLLNDAVLIETHTDKGKGTPKENKQLIQTYVLLSALKNGENIAPVQFVIMEYKNNENRLYLAVAMTKIKEADVVGNTGDEDVAQTNLLSASNISIVDIFRNINPQDKYFLKYVPDEFLNEEQKRAKAVALDIEADKYSKTNVKYSKDVTSAPLTPREKKLQEMVDYWKRMAKLSKQTDYKRSDVRKIALDIKKRTGSRINTDKLTDMLLELYTALANDKDTDPEFWDIQARKIASEVDLEIPYTISAEKQEIIDEISKNGNKPRISLSEYVQGDVRSKYDGKLRPFINGTAKLIRYTSSGDNATPLDVMWGEWSGKYPWLFEPELGSLEQPQRLIEIQEFLFAPDVDEFDYYEGDRIDMLSADILKGASDLVPIETLADKEKNKRLAVENEFKQYKQDAIDSYEAAIEAVMKANEEKFSEQEKKHNREMSDTVSDFITLIEKDKEENKKLIAEFEVKYKDKYNKQLETKDKAKLREQLERETKIFSKWLNKPNKEKSVPTPLQKPLWEFLHSLNVVRGEKTNKTWQHIFSELELAAVKMNQSANLAEQTDAIVIPKDMIAHLSGLAEKYDSSTSIYNMSAADLKILVDVVKMLKHTVIQAHEMLANERYEKVADVAEESIKHMQNLKHRSDSRSKLRRVLFSDFMNANSIKKFLGEAGGSTIQSIRTALDNQIIKVDRVKNDFQEMLEDNDVTAKEVSKWRKTDATTFHLESGETIRMNPVQIMNLYLLALRQQAKEHLLEGGITVNENLKSKTKKKLQTLSNNKELSKSEIYDEIINDGSFGVHKLTVNDIANICGTLTDQQKAIAEAMQRYMSTVCAKWGNEITQALYGYDGYTEEHYVPIITNRDFIALMDSNNEENVSYWAIQNQSMTKQTVEHAKNPIMVGDMFEVFAEHCNNMIMYNAYTLPLSDAMKWLNYKNEGTSVRHELNQTFGPGAEQFVKNMLTDFNGVKKKAYSEDVMEGFVNRAKGAKVAFNARVAIQQGTAYLKASLYIDEKYLTKAAATSAKHGWSGMRKAKKYCPIALWKSWGFFDTNLGPNMTDLILDNQTVSRKIKEAGMFGAEFADAWTWGVLWNACEYYVQENFKDLKVDSEEYYKAVSDKLSEIVDNTQVVDTPYHRTQIMRSKGMYAKLVTPFMAEPMTSYNMLMSATYDAYHSDGEAKNKAIKFALKTAWVWTVTQVAVSAVAALVDGFRKDDDDEEGNWWQRYRKTWLRSSKDNLLGEAFMNPDAELWRRFIITGNLSPLGLVPFAKEFLSMIDGYDVGRMDLDVLNDIADIARSFTKSATPYSKAYTVAKLLSDTTGYGIGNILRTFKSVYNTFSPENIDKQYRRADEYKKLYKYTLSGEMNLYDRVYKKLLEDGADEKTIQSGVKNVLEDNDIRIAQSAIAYADGDMDEYIGYIEDIGKTGFDERLTEGAVSSYFNEMKTAKSFLDEGDVEKYNYYLENMLLSGIDKATLEKAIQGIELDETESSLSQLYSKNDLIAALDSGNITAYEHMHQSIVDIKTENGKYSTVFDNSDVLDMIDAKRYSDAKRVISSIIELRELDGDERADIMHSIKNTLNSEYRDRYIEASESEREAIERTLQESGLYKNHTFKEEIYATDGGSKLLWEEIKRNGYNSKKYQYEEYKYCEMRKEYNAVEKPNPTGTLKGYAMEEYYKAVLSNKNSDIKKYRNIGVELYGSVTAFDKAYDKYRNTNEAKAIYKEKRNKTFYYQP